MLETLEVLRPVLKIEENTPTYGRLSLEPLERGYGMTLGNALRRVLLSSISGAAITAVHIDGVLHEFSTVPGVREDVIEVLMNLKHVPVRSKSKEPRIISFDSNDLPVDFFNRKQAVLRAKDLPFNADIEFVDPEAAICTLERDAHLVMDFYIEQGTGYISSERQRPSFLPVDALLTDAIFSPVSRVNYEVQPARVGQRIDYERLVLEIWTNGVIFPDKAVGEAAKIVQTYFGNIVASLQPEENSGDDFVFNIYPDNTEGGVKKSSKSSDSEILSRPIHDLELTIRGENCLLRGGILTVGDLLQKTRDDLLKIRNLGKISLKEIEDKLKSVGLNLREKKVTPIVNPEAVSENGEADSSDNSDSGDNSADEAKADSVASEIFKDFKDLAAEEAEEAKQAEEAEKLEKTEEVLETGEAKEAEKVEKLEKVEEVLEAENPEKPEKSEKVKKTKKAAKSGRAKKAAKNDNSEISAEAASDLFVKENDEEAKTEINEELPEEVN